MPEKDFDDILTQLKLGPWNFLYYFTIGIVYFTLTAQAFSSVFVVPNMEFRCDTEDIDGAINENDQCSYYFNETGVVEKYNATEVKCTKWVYEDEYFTDTITQEFNLICDKSYLRPTFMSIHVIGKTIGSPLNGFLADRYGRKKLLSVTSLVAVLNFLLSTFLTNFYAILATRVITGVVISPIFQTGFIMCNTNDIIALFLLRGFCCEQELNWSHSCLLAKIYCQHFHACSFQLPCSPHV